MKSIADRRNALMKLAYGEYSTTWSPTVGISNPQPTVAGVLNGIGLAQARGIGTPEERRDAFGKIVNSGLVSTSPAWRAMKMIGGGVLGRAITGMFTNNPFMKGIGAGVGAILADDRN